jgi:hypothetical protein
MLVLEPGRFSIVQEIVQTVQGRSPDGDIPVQTTLLTVVYQLNEQGTSSPSSSSSTASPVSIHDRYSLTSCNVRFCVEFETRVLNGTNHVPQTDGLHARPSDFTC